LKRSGAVF